jgi:hypothetical protein
MRKLLRISALLMVVMLAALATRMPNAMAQEATPDEEAEVFDQLTELEGLESAVSRYYALDYEALMSSASPAAGEDFAFPEGMQLLGGAVFKFDSDDNAQAGRDKAAELVGSEVAAEGELEFTEVEIDDLNDETIALETTVEEEGLGATHSLVVITQEDEYLYVAIGVATGAEASATQTTVDLVKYMIDTDAGDGDGTFNADGTSEGGLWDKFPAADNEIVTGLIPEDEQIFPAHEDHG